MESDVTRLLDAVRSGEAQAASRLLPLVYDELRKLAAQKLAAEKPGMTLQATALVHEAYIRLVAPSARPTPGEAANPEAGTSRSIEFDNRRHFFAAAAEAMRRILVESARRKMRHKHGGGFHRVDLDPARLTADSPAEELLAIDDALECLARTDAQAARLVALRFFGGLSVEEAAEMAGLARSTAYEHWAYARAWLRRHLRP